MLAKVLAKVRTLVWLLRILTTFSGVVVCHMMFGIRSLRSWFALARERDFREMFTE